MKIFRFFIFVFIFMTLSACTQIFENEADRKARKALQDLMAIQDAYYKEHNRYARNLGEIEKYHLQYHTGIVYLEIQSAGKNGYRAISLPAESTTGRVFAFDTEKGGFYEMDAEEVSQYVLGALNFIRQKQREQRTVDLVSSILVAVLIGFGLLTLRKAGWSGHKLTLASYFIGLLPMTWALALLNHMHRGIVVTPLIWSFVIGSFTVAGWGFLIGLRDISRMARFKLTGPIMGLSIASLIMSVFSAVAITYVLLHNFPK